jgi:hypothetical protein
MRQQTIQSRLKPGRVRLLFNPAPLGASLLMVLLGCSVGGGEEHFENNWGTLTEGPPFLGFETDDEVAVLRLAAPRVASFALRGTVPLPKGVFPRSDGSSPFVVRDSMGNLSEAQVEIVSRYANDNDGADVVEVLAAVARPSGALPGDRIEYTVIWSPHLPAAPRITSAVEQLLETPDSLVLRTRDVFGHSYTADLLADLRNSEPIELKVKRAGPVANQVRTFENLEPAPPVAGGTGTLPHMMGVHAYITTWRDEDFISLDLRIHNGHDGGQAATDQDDPLGKLYFDDLELVVPGGWTLFQAYPTPSTGTPYAVAGSKIWPIVAPIGGGKLHMLPRQAMFHRRFVLCRVGSEARASSTLFEEGLGFCSSGLGTEGVERLSWWNQLTPRYYPQNVRLPDFSYQESRTTSRTHLKDRFEATREAITSGIYVPNETIWPIVYPAMGWAHPWGPKPGGMHGGAEINFWDGFKTAWSASNEGYRRFQINHRMVTERHPTALYDFHGDAHKLEAWVQPGQNGDYLPVYLFMIPWLSLGDPFGFSNTPSFQRNAVAAQGRQPDYEGNLAGFQHIDSEHLIRATRSAKVLTWLGNDAISKDDLRLQAEISRSSFSFFKQSEAGAVISTGAARIVQHIEEFGAGDGIPMDRGPGWLIDTAATAYAIESPAWRAKMRPWFEKVVALVEDGQSDCMGAIMSVPKTAHFNGEYRVLQSISEAILQNALWSVRSTVFEGASPTLEARLANILTKSTGAMIGPLGWNTGEGQPNFYTALGPFDQNLPAFCNFVPSGGTELTDSVQTWSGFYWGYLITRDPFYLYRATQMAQAAGTLLYPGSLTSRGVGMDPHGGDLENRIAILSLIQDLSLDG